MLPSTFLTSSKALDRTVMLAKALAEWRTTDTKPALSRGKSGPDVISLADLPYSMNAWAACNTGAATH